MFTTSQVRSTYSGKRSACMCGCKGKHSYASAFMAEASTDRGYPVTADEVSDRSVATVCRKVERAFAEQTAEQVDWQSDFVAVNVDGRTYAVYFAN